MNLNDVMLSITGFNGTIAGKNAITSEALREAWLLSKARSNKANAIDYLIAYKENETDCLRLFMTLRRR